MVLYDNRDDTSVPNNVLIEKGGLVTKYEKDTSNSFLHYVDAGVLTLKKEILNTVPADENFSLEQEILPGFIAKRECAGFVTHERFYDIGTPERLKCFESYLMRQNQGAETQS